MHKLEQRSFDRIHRPKSSTVRPSRRIDVDNSVPFSSWVSAFFLPQSILLTGPSSVSLSAFLTPFPARTTLVRALLDLKFP